MAVKSFKYNELSTKECDHPDCDKKLKKRLVESRKAKNIKKCYKHHIIAENKKGHQMKVK